MKKIARAIVIVIATAVGGRPVKVDDVLLVPEDIGEDAARDLMRMSRPRAEAADQKATERRLAEYEKSRAKIRAKEDAVREDAEANAELEADEFARLEKEAKQMIEVAQGNVKEIIAAAETQAANLVSGATDEAVKIVEDAREKAGAIITEATAKAKAKK